MITSLGPAQYQLLFQGALWTIALSAIGFAFGIAGGLVIALLRTAPSRVIQTLAAGFIEIFRGTPLLLQLFIVFYGVGLLNLSVSPWVAVSIAFTLHASAFLGEIWRGSIQSIPLGRARRHPLSASIIGRACATWSCRRPSRSRSRRRSGSWSS